MNILVSGGLGYIGSHTVVELLNNGHEVIVADNLSNSSIEVIDNIKKITGKDFKFYKVDLKNKVDTQNIFETHKFDAVIHFAGYKSVGESVLEPIMYYENNLLTTINLSELCLKNNVNNFVFSSSATVYGDNTVPFKEDMVLLPTVNPYGETKIMCERILTDIAKVNKEFCVSILRYFNPIGAHESGLLLEKPNGIPNNLIPYIVEVAKGNQEKLHIYGNDYSTIDGTGIRDYIHVVDLASGHLKALERKKTGISIYNIGTGKGYSVLEVINCFEKVHNIKIPFEIMGRREGDIAKCYADCSKAINELGFKTKYNIEDMCRDSYKR